MPVRHWKTKMAILKATRLRAGKLGVGEYLNIKFSHWMKKNQFWQSFETYISRVFTDHSQMSGFRHFTALKVRIVERVEFSCPFIVWSGQSAVWRALGWRRLVACRRLANSTHGGRSPADEISHLSAIAQMAARTVAAVVRAYFNFFRHWEMLVTRILSISVQINPLKYLRNR